MCPANGGIKFNLYEKTCYHGESAGWPCWPVLWEKPCDAQVDPHFSQYYIQPMTMNPAFTGAFDGDYRAVCNLEKPVWQYT